MLEQAGQAKSANASAISPLRRAVELSNLAQQERAMHVRVKLIRSHRTRTRMHSTASAVDLSALALLTIPPLDNY